MDKYAVDKENDPVEKRAIELTKTGNLNRARERAAKEVNDKRRKGVGKTNTRD